MYSFHYVLQDDGEDVCFDDDEDVCFEEDFRFLSKEKNIFKRLRKLNNCLIFLIDQSCLVFDFKFQIVNLEKNMS